MTEIFEPFPKLARLSRGCIVTEKIDGTNAQIYIRPHEGNHAPPYLGCEVVYEGLAYEMFVGSRTRTITPGKNTDNYGFAGWVWENADELVKLGPGRHYGEWYGKGIQRGYGLAERRFALFNTSQWPAERPRPSCVEVVPVLYQGAFDSSWIDGTLTGLKITGSKAVPGFMDPEGIVVYHAASRASFKKTFDDRHKEAA